MTFGKLFRIVLLVVLFCVGGLLALGQEKPASPAPPLAAGPSTAPVKYNDPFKPPAPTAIAADSELLLIFQAHRVTSQLIEEKLKAAGIPELQQEIRVLQARFDAWKKAHNVPPGWVWNDQAKQFEKPAPAAAAPAPEPAQPPKKGS